MAWWENLQLYKYNYNYNYNHKYYCLYNHKQENEYNTTKKKKETKITYFKIGKISSSQIAGSGLWTGHQRGEEKQQMEQQATPPWFSCYCFTLSWLEERLRRTDTWERSHMLFLQKGRRQKETLAMDSSITRTKFRSVCRVLFFFLSFNGEV